MAQKAMQLKPGETSVLDTIGWIYFKKGDANKAVEYLRRAQAGNPAALTINYHLGMAFHKTGNNADARKYLTKAVSGAGDFPGKAEARKVLATL
jgi:predicted Zn-dependent protease